ncbi:MAG: hypothetical protein K6A63_04665 [Acholeplasmatales bacterium]|nr:hypothetical protein [Acholeplasmatales bacterium]
MLLSLLNKKEMLKFLDLAIYMVDIDKEPTEVEKKVLKKMINELEPVKDEYTFRLTDTVENTVEFFVNANNVVKNIVYLNLVTISMEDDLYNTSEWLFLEKLQKQFEISNEKRRELISLVYAYRDLREKSIRIVKN